MTGKVTLITDVPCSDSCAKLQHEFSDILAWLFVLNDSLFIRSLESHFSSYSLK